MKNIFVLLSVLLIVCSGCSSSKEEPTPPPPQKTTVALYDKNKEAVAYIDYVDDETIYLWDGTPVAYLTPERLVYHFDGRFLGWFEEGVLYDREAYAVGAEKGITRGEIFMAVTALERVKGLKHLKPVKSVPHVPPVHSIFKDRWSETSLTDLFLPEEE